MNFRKRKNGGVEIIYIIKMSKWQNSNDHTEKL